jgi:hypothetical protein
MACGLGCGAGDTCVPCGGERFSCCDGVSDCRAGTTCGPARTCQRYGGLSQLEDLDLIPLADGDLEIRGAPIFRAPEAVWREVMSIAIERQQAANWLIGEDEIYSEVTCDT